MKILDLLFKKKEGVHLEDGNPALVQAMEELALRDNSENRKLLYKVLLGSVLLVPVPEIPPGLGPGQQTLKTNVQLQLVGMLDSNRLRVTLVFTDVEALRNWNPNTPYLGMKAQELFRFILGTDIEEVVINPFDPIRRVIRPGGRITRAELDFLSQGLTPSGFGPNGVQFRLKSKEQVFVGLPARRPTREIEQTLAEKAMEILEIDELYLFQMAATGGSGHTTIGIQTKKTIPTKQQEEIVKDLSECVRPKLKASESLDFLFLSGSLGEKIRGIGALIFQRT